MESFTPPLLVQNTTRVEFSQLRTCSTAPYIVRSFVRSFLPTVRPSVLPAYQPHNEANKSLTADACLSKLQSIQNTHPFFCHRRRRHRLAH
jgi:hypothetical protein